VTDQFWKLKQIKMSNTEGNLLSPVSNSQCVHTGTQQRLSIILRT